MRYSLLDLLACPYTKEPLVLIGGQEVECPIPAPYIDRATRVSAPGAIVGPMPASGVAATEFAGLLASLASGPGDPARNELVVVREGLLVACSSGRWYPIIDDVPQVLPDSLRDWTADLAFLRERMAPRLPPPLVARLERATSAIDTRPRQGDHYKTSELSLLDKVGDKTSFLGPGLLSPFNPYWLGHSSDLIRGFAVCIPFMKLSQGSYVLDAGSGYSWTTEWLMKMGIRAVGLELNRQYLDVGRTRMGPNNQPHLVVGDTESLPFKAEAFQTVLAFDAFHHIPNRVTAMAEFCRVLTGGGRVMLVEPGETHEHSQAAVDAMSTFGTMEIGMGLADVQSYVDSIPEFLRAKETFLYPLASDDSRDRIATSDMRKRDFIGWGLFSVDKRG